MCDGRDQLTQRIVCFSFVYAQQSFGHRSKASTSILTGAEKLRSSEGTGFADTPSKTKRFSAASTRSTVDVPRSDD